MDKKEHQWVTQDRHEECANCDANREMTSTGWRYWIVTKTPTPEWMKHIVKDMYIDFPVLFGSAVPKCATGLELLDF